MFRDRVVAHYVHRGYSVEADKIIEGESGSPHRFDLYCAGDLGKLVVFFGDDPPLEGPELASLRRTATDVGAGMVVAIQEATSSLRAAAREHRVILIDDDALEGPKEESPLIESIADEPLVDIPVPADDASPPLDLLAPDPPSPVTDQDDAEVGSFAWLPGDDAAHASHVPEAPSDIYDEASIVRVPRQVNPRNQIPLHWIWGPMLYLTATLILIIVGAWLLL